MENVNTTTSIPESMLPESMLPESMPTNTISLNDNTVAPLYIVIALIVVVLFLGGLGVGIYFIVSAKKKKKQQTLAADKQPGVSNQVKLPGSSKTKPTSKPQAAPNYRPTTPNYKPKGTFYESQPQPIIQPPQKQQPQQPQPIIQPQKQQPQPIIQPQKQKQQPQQPQPIIQPQKQKQPQPQPIIQPQKQKQPQPQPPQKQSGTFLLEKKPSTCTPGNTQRFDYMRRVKFGSTWKCPVNWEDTGCGWDDGETLGEYQCRKLKGSAPPTVQPTQTPPLPTGPAPDGKIQLGIPNIPMTKGVDPWNFSVVQKTEGKLSVIDDTTFELVYPANCGANAKKCGSNAGMNGKASPKCCFPASSIEFGYQVYFAPDFDFVNAGKLPGVWIGDPGASGGEWIPKGGSCRVMWRTDNGSSPHLVAYLYFPTEIGGSQQAAISKQNIKGVKTTGETGVDVWRKEKNGTAPFPITRGSWISVSFRLVLNALGKSDGSLTLSVNGQQQTVNNLTWRESDLKINGIMMTSWFGGSTVADYASTKDERAQFRNFWVKKG